MEVYVVSGRSPRALSRQLLLLLVSQDAVSQTYTSMYDTGRVMRGESDQLEREDELLGVLSCKGIARSS